jgi:hypothetical protein
MIRETAREANDEAKQSMETWTNYQSEIAGEV